MRVHILIYFNRAVISVLARDNLSNQKGDSVYIFWMYSGRCIVDRPAEIMPGIILEYLACLGIRELCGNNRE